MKRNLFVLALICLLISSCIEEVSGIEESGGIDVPKPVSVSGVSFKKMDLNGVGALALVAPGKVANSAIATKADEGNGVFLLYEVNEDGTLVEVDYTITVETEGDQNVVEEAVTAHLKLAMQSVFTIGDKWLWLYNCQYFCENLEEIENETLRNSVIKVIDDFGTGHSFLVRRSDGALFPWDDVSRPTTSPYLTEIYQWEVDTSVKIVGDNIVSSVIDSGGGPIYKLYYLEDKGDILEVKQLLNDSVWSDGLIYPVPGEDAFLCHLYHVDGFVVMFPKTATIRLISNSNLLNGVYNPSILGIYNNRVFTNAFDDGIYYYDNIRNSIFEGCLHLDSSVEDVYLYQGCICSVTLEKEETVYLRSGSNKGFFHFSADENDPMCFVVSQCSKKAENGITLPPGKYEFFLSGVEYDHVYGTRRVLYVDKSGERTHRVGPNRYIHFLTVDTAAQTASWDELYMSYWGDFEVPDTQWENGPLKIMSMDAGICYLALLDLEKKEYSFKTFKIPDGFPSEDWEYTGLNAYKIVGNSEICIYSLETMQIETFPIIMTELPPDIVGNIEWGFDGGLMMFYGHAMTLEGNDITIYIPVTGDKRGVARISIDETSGAGDNVAQIIRLN